MVSLEEKRTLSSYIRTKSRELLILLSFLYEKLIPDLLIISLTVT